MTRLFVLLILLITGMGYSSQPRPITASSATIENNSSDASNANWQYQFGFAGSTYEITALGASKKNVYASLNPNVPTELSKLRVNGKVAYWDGGAWHRMGAGTTEPPSDFEAIGDDVYMCGAFSRADDKTIAGIARWSEKTLSWSAVGSGVGPIAFTEYDDPYINCNAITSFGNNLYMGGEFEEVDGAKMLNIAKWDGIKWSPVGYGLHYAPKNELGSAYTLAALPDGKLVVGGYFTHVFLNDTDSSKAPMNYIAIWDPVAKQFLPMGSGLSGPPNEIIAVGNDVYAGGNFQTAGGLIVNGIARWDGSKWNALGSGLGNGRIRVMAFAAGKLYVGGSFGDVGGQVAHRIARWDGTNWAGLDPTDSTTDDVFGIAIPEEGSVYVGGKFRKLGGLEVDNIARWREADQKWRPLGSGPIDDGGTWAANISALYTLPDGKILVAGDYGWAAGKRINRLGTWDPSTKEWAEWQGGANGSVFVIKRNGDLLYFGGGFTQIGGISAPGIATYNLTNGQWSSLGTGLDGAVYDVAFAPDGIVYVGGKFTATPNGAALLLALYNPATQIWSSTPLGFDPPSGYNGYVYYPSVTALVADSEGVLVGGWFRLRKLNGAFVQEPIPVSLIYWNRKTGVVSKYGNGPRLSADTEGSIATLLPMPDGSFYVGGHFNTIGPGMAASNVAYHTAAGWEQLGAGVRSDDDYGPAVHVIQRSGNSLFVGGDFATAGNTTSSQAAVWDIASKQWQALGDGFYGADFESRRGVHAIAFGADAAYFGGHFWFVGDGQASGFAAWSYVPPNVVLNKRVSLPLVQR